MRCATRSRSGVALGVMETHFAGRRCFAADGSAVADVALHSYTHGTHEATIDLEPQPRVQARLARVAAAIANRRADRGEGENLQTQFLCRRSPIEIYADPEDAFRHALAVIDRHFVAVGTVEWFLESIIAMTPMLGWHAVPVPTLNAAPRAPRSVRRSELDPDLVRRIEQRNQTDRRLHETLSRRLWREIAARRT
jgi:hypothetical protein